MNPCEKLDAVQIEADSRISETDRQFCEADHNLFMEVQNTDLDEIYDRFGVDYDLLSLLMYREMDEQGNFHIRWGEQKVS